MREKHCLVLLLTLCGWNGPSAALDRFNPFIIVRELYMTGVSPNIPQATFVAQPDWNTILMNTNNDNIMLLFGQPMKRKMQAKSVFI